MSSTGSRTSRSGLSSVWIAPVISSGGVGHLNFASGVSTKSPDADHTGRYGFRYVKDVAKVRELLDRARRR